MLKYSNLQTGHHSTAPCATAGEAHSRRSYSTAPCAAAKELQHGTVRYSPGGTAQHGAVRYSRGTTARRRALLPGRRCNARNSPL